jgi:arylsulfatase
VIVSWPKTIHDGGAIRGQYVDAIDIAPTLAAAAGTRFPKSLDGRREIPVAGKSIVASLKSASAPSARTVQYFELRGNRAITSGRWRAVALHKQLTDFASDTWELYDTEADFSESTDLAARYPEKVEELKKLWWREARKYSTPPLAEAPERYRVRERFDESGGDRPAVPAQQPTAPASSPRQ